MTYFYDVDLGIHGIPRLGKCFDIDQAFEHVMSGGNVWTKYKSDAKELAYRFRRASLDNIHFDVDDHPGVRYTMEHYHVDDYGVRGRPHICFGDAINDHNSHDILRL